MEYVDSWFLHFSCHYAKGNCKEWQSNLLYVSPPWRNSSMDGVSLLIGYTWISASSKWIWTEQILLKWLENSTKRIHFWLYLTSLARQGWLDIKELHFNLLCIIGTQLRLKDGIFAIILRLSREIPVDFTTRAEMYSVILTNWLGFQSGRLGMLGRVRFITMFIDSDIINFYI